MPGAPAAWRDVLRTLPDHIPVFAQRAWALLIHSPPWARPSYAGADSSRTGQPARWLTGGPEFPPRRPPRDRRLSAANGGET